LCSIAMPSRHYHPKGVVMLRRDYNRVKELRI
jgi:hypothetical protein